MSTVIVTAPAAEPVTLAEVKSQRNITGNDHNAELTRLISAARQYVENYTGRALITQTWDLFLDKFEKKIELPFPVLQSVTTVKYTDTGGVQQTLSNTLYTVVTNSEPGYIVPAYLEDWPDVREVPDAVEIQFVAGYGAASTDIPQDLRHAVLLLIGTWNENTEDVQPFNMNQIPFGVKSLLDPHRMFRV
jgi:uncharacterized phiE125 gp8 family phage protein